MLAKVQPKHGERVLTCSHTGNSFAKPFHFFRTNPPTEFTRPDQTTDSATWMVLCNRCYQRHGTDMGAAITGDALWQGDEPIVKDVSN